MSARALPRWRVTIAEHTVRPGHWPIPAQVVVLAASSGLEAREEAVRTAYRSGDVPITAGRLAKALATWVVAVEIRR